MDYPWYELVADSDSITQGDILPHCPVVLANRDVYETAVRSEGAVAPIEIDDPVEIVTVDIVILTQACDIEHTKVDSLVVCPVWSLSALIESNQYFAGSKARENLRQGNEPAFHLLNNFESPSFQMEFSVVEFHRLYSLPKDFLRTVAANTPLRLRLLPPYREHLSQAFARYFMRVGLPSDIERSVLKQFSPQPD